MIIDEYSEDVYEKVRAILAEHFPNFLFCVMDDSGDVYYDYTNLPVGKMLINEMQEDIKSEALQDDWVIDWEVDEDNGGENAY